MSDIRGMHVSTMALKTDDLFCPTVGDGGSAHLIRAPEILTQTSFLHFRLPNVRLDNHTDTRVNTEFNTSRSSNHTQVSGRENQCWLCPHPSSQSGTLILSLQREYVISVTATTRQEIFKYSSETPHLAPVPSPDPILGMDPISFMSPIPISLSLH